MRTSPYILDIREKVIKFIKSGKTQKEASAHFSISICSIGIWWRRYKQEGHFEPRKRPGKKARLCPKELEKFLSEHPNALLKDIGNHFEMTGEGALYWMKKLGYSYKKKSSPTWSLTRKNEKNT